MQLSIKTLALIAILAAAPFSSYAADEGSHKHPHHGQQLQAALDQLNLTDDQKAKTTAIMEKSKADNAAYMEAHGAEIKAAREAGDKEKMKSLMAPMLEKHKAKMDEIKAVLTDDQKKKFEELYPAHSEHHHHDNQK